MTPTESASGRREGPLPADVPRDEDHLVTPRDHRAEQLAAQLQGRTANDVEHDYPKPKPPKSPELADVLLWRARAFQNRAEARAYAAERDLAEQKAAAHHRQVMGMKTAHRERLAEVQELRAQVADLRAQLEEK